MDRNSKYKSITEFAAVALRKESVDRNSKGMMVAVDGRVALRKESVDRNPDDSNLTRALVSSLSVRRAWIEIAVARCQKVPRLAVALRKESVDRNKGIIHFCDSGFSRSP